MYKTHEVIFVFCLFLCSKYPNCAQHLDLKKNVIDLIKWEHIIKVFSTAPTLEILNKY